MVSSGKRRRRIRRRAGYRLVVRRRKSPAPADGGNQRIGDAETFRVVGKELPQDVQLGLGARVLAVVAVILGQLQRRPGCDRRSGLSARRAFRYACSAAGPAAGSFSFSSRSPRPSSATGPAPGTSSACFRLSDVRLRCSPAMISRCTFCSRSQSSCAGMRRARFGQGGIERQPKRAVKRIAHHGQHPGKPALRGIGGLGEVISLKQAPGENILVRREGEIGLVDHAHRGIGAMRDERADPVDWSRCARWRR